MALFFDVETTGLPIRGNLPYGINPVYNKLESYNNARIVQITIMLCDENLNEIELKDFIIKADGFAINNEKFHGITNEISAMEGISIIEFANILQPYLKRISHMIAHNANFDISILKSELYRYGMQSIIDELDTKTILCTMKKTKYIINSRNSYGIKDPSLAELYQYVFNEQIQNAHNAKYDVINMHAAIKILYDWKQLTFNEPVIYSKLTDKINII